MDVIRNSKSHLLQLLTRSSFVKTERMNQSGYLKNSVKKTGKGDMIFKMNRLYLPDCICPDCKHCDKEKDICKIGRWRYPTDGCFDFTDINDPSDETSLEKTISRIMNRNGNLK